MPVMDGYDFCKEVRARPEWVTIPFLFLTARGEGGEDISAGRDLGVEDYLVKPLSGRAAYRVRLPGALPPTPCGSSSSRAL